MISTPADVPPPPPDRSERMPGAPGDSNSNSNNSGDAVSPSTARVTIDGWRWAAAAAAAIALQITTIFLLFATLLVAFAASDTGFFGETKEPEVSGWLVLPVFLLAVASYIGSGAAAAKILRDGRGWLALVVVPLIAAVALRLLTAF